MKDAATRGKELTVRVVGGRPGTIRTVKVDLASAAVDLESRICARLFGHAPATHMPLSSIIEKVRSGLPVASIARMHRYLHIDEAAVLSYVGMSTRTYMRRKQDHKPLSPVESDRLYRLAKIEARAEETCQSTEQAVAWLKTNIDVVARRLLAAALSDLGLVPHSAQKA